MEDYAGRILADRYRLPLPPSDEYELIETRAFDTRSGQEVLVRQVPLPEVVDAELLDGPRGGPAAAVGRRASGELPAVRRAIAAAQAAASVPDHPRLDQVFDVFAEGGSLWIVSELVPARPLAALIADEPLSPYRAAEVAADVLTALRVLHAHGWTHRNITTRTVLICEDGRVVLTGLAAGAAEDALCGYDPVPPREGVWPFEGDGYAAAITPGAAGTGPEGGAVAGRAAGPGGSAAAGGALAGYGAGADSGAVTRYAAGPDPTFDSDSYSRSDSGTGAGPAVRGPGSGAGDGAGAEAAAYAPLVAPGYDTGPRYTDHITPGGSGERPDLKAAARAGAIAAYRAGAQAAARITEQRKAGAEPGQEAAAEPRPAGSNLPRGYSYPYGGPEGGGAWHGATPRRQALPPAETEALPPAETAALPPAETEARAPQSEQPPQGAPAPPAPQRAPQRAAALPPVPARPVLPAQLALPQGYRQADAPDTPDGPATGRFGHGDPQRPGTPGPATRPAAGPGSGYGQPRPGQGGTPPRTQPQHESPAPATAPATAPAGGGWGSGPRSGLDAERARQTRMAVVGAVTERWSPEQAQAVHGPWQLAAPVGPATDLWGLGALLYRAVQGHAPYPEDSVAELVELVCAESPAFAEECGPLRPVVESLLRQDPTERPDFEELRGWLRSLVRSAPEPDGGFAMFPLPEPDPARLPVVRRRGDLHGRHRSAEHPRKPRSLGRSLLLGILALLAGAVAYAMFFMPQSAGQGGQKAAGMGQPSHAQSQGQSPGPSPSPKPSGSGQAPSPSVSPPGGGGEGEREGKEEGGGEGEEGEGRGERGREGGGGGREGGEGGRGGEGKRGEGEGGGGEEGKGGGGRGRGGEKEGGAEKEGETGGGKGEGGGEGGGARGRAHGGTPRGVGVRAGGHRLPPPRGHAGATTEPGLYAQDRQQGEEFAGRRRVRTAGPARRAGRSGRLRGSAG
ncbi:protein kinase [Streptomyces sp. ICC4]|uniref:protein kinase n=1 Tax=Streptomyces sp. ICC4 TaxID=2099584 RepID=UPI000DC79446|nr:protein kinase [Streptomyces sp. ICC4]AWZ09148.1 serine/threonine protein kinase [Streptomyces sp. ICC4]